MAERVHTMEQVVASARESIARAADYMSCCANHCRRDCTIDVGSFAWLSTGTYLFVLESPGSLQPSLQDNSRLLNRLVRLLFVWSCQSPGTCILSFMFVSQNQLWG